MSEERYAEFQEGDDAILRVRVARADDYQSFIEFRSMQGPYSIRVPNSELTRVDRPQRGLPYGWWKSRDFWVAAICLTMFIAMLFVIVSAWYFDWKPVL